MVVRDCVVIDEHHIVAAAARDRGVASQREPPCIRVGHDLHVLGEPCPKVRLQRVVVVDHHNDLARLSAGYINVPIRV